MNTSKLVALILSVLCFLDEAGYAGEPKDSFPLVKVATDIVQLHRPQTLAGFVAIPIDESNWALLTRDSDLRPFLKLKESRADLSLVMVVPANPKKDSTYCVYFRGQDPLGFVEAKTSETGKITDEDVRNAYKEIAKKIVKTGTEELYFTDVILHTDDGSPLPAIKILSGGAR